VILQVVQATLMVMEQLELHYCSLVDLKDLEDPVDLLGMMDIGLESFLGVHFAEQQCWAVPPDWVGSHLEDHPGDHLVDLLEDHLEDHQVDQEDRGHLKIAM